MSLSFPFPLRRTAVAASLACLALAGCGGSDDAPADKNGADETEQPIADACAGIPAVAAQTGYPAYEAPEANDADGASATAVECAIMKHYEAGYAIISHQDIDPWNDDDAALNLLVASQEAQPSDPANALTLHHEPQAAPVYAQAASLQERRVFAKRPGGTGDPWECRVASQNQEDITRDIETCLATLRDMEAEHNAQPIPLLARSLSPLAATPLAANSTSNDAGAALIDTSQWTALGTLLKQVRHNDTSSLGKPDYRGLIKTTFDLYRLNSMDSHDYYLVKAVLSTTPNYWLEICVHTMGCDYHNNHHKLGFSLQRKHGSAAAEHGILVDYSPKNVIRAQTYNAKLGGGLKVGSKVTDKGAEMSEEASISGEISTSYTFHAATIAANEGDDSRVDFTVSHATGELTPFVGLYDGNPTTIGTLQTTHWVLYKFERDERDNDPDTGMILEVHQQSGAFGEIRLLGFFNLYFRSDYNIQSQDNSGSAYTTTFALPHFSVKVQNAAGAFVAPPKSATAPLKVTPGQVLTLLVDSGGAAEAGTNTGATTHPVALNWQILGLPSSFIASSDSGNKKSVVELIVRRDAKVGEQGFLRFNTLPRGAAPGLQAGNLAIPYEIVAAE